MPPKRVSFSRSPSTAPAARARTMSATSNRLSSRISGRRDAATDLGALLERRARLLDVEIEILDRRDDPGRVGLRPPTVGVDDHHLRPLQRLGAGADPLDVLAPARCPTLIWIRS